MSDPLDPRTRALIRSLLYPTIFEQELDEAHAQRVSDLLLHGGFAAPLPDLEAAMKTALASGADLSDWIAPQHCDAAVRAYLERVLRRLRGGPPTSAT